MKHTQVTRHVRKAGVRVHEIACQGGGRAAVCSLAGRVISLRLPGLDENLFWSSPDLHKHDVWRKNMWGVTGGIGGLRVWFAPEYAYHWMGKPDLVHYSNYKVPRASDPGSYDWGKCTPASASLHARISLRDHRDGSKVAFRVERTIASTPNPIGTRGLRYVGIRLQHRLELLRANKSQRVDMWHLIQMPIGGRLLVPTVGRAKPLVYFNSFRRGNWKCAGDRLTWQFTGDQCAKIGLDTAQVTGRAGVLRRLTNGDWAALIWQFPSMPGADYCDGPDARRARQQVVQAWDGFGFGEIEYHSPAVSANDPTYADSSLLWCFAGPRKHVNAVAETLLGRRW